MKIHEGLRRRRSYYELKLVDGAKAEGVTDLRADLPRPPRLRDPAALRLRAGTVRAARGPRRLRDGFPFGSGQPGQRHHVHRRVRRADPPDHPLAEVSRGNNMVLSDIEIANSVQMKPIKEVAEKLYKICICK